MTDKLELIGNSLIQYGKENNRIYLMKLSKKDYPGIIDYMDNLAKNDGYTKILAKIPAELQIEFINNGYETEAAIENYFKGEKDACFVCKYFCADRKNFSNRNEMLSIIQFCTEKGKESHTVKLNNRFKIKQLKNEHISQLTELYKSVFESYPFPIFDGNYIYQTMTENIDYFGVFENDKLVAASSSEMDIKNKNTEMTDFATLKEYRGNSLSYHLLTEMEKVATDKKIKTAYTIARAKNTGINFIFAKKGYKFGGTLINNTNICGDIETMNVWYKNLG